MSRINHSNCTHPRTPAGRAMCRKAIKKNIQPEVEMNVRAKGSKVVHRVNASAYACTKKPVKQDATTTSDAVTCKNCLKA